MSVQKKTQNKKKKNKEKVVKSKHASKPGSKHAAMMKQNKTKHGKRKDSKMKKMKKHSKHDPNKARKKKSKASKKPMGTGPNDVPVKKAQAPGEVAVEPKKEGSGSLRVEKTQLSDDSARRKKEEKEKKKVMKKEEKKKEEKKVEKKSKKEEKNVKKKEENKPKEPKVKPVPPGTDSSPPTPEKKVSNLYNILGDVSDTKSSLDGQTPEEKEKKKEEKKEEKKKEEEVKVVVTPDAKTPDTVGPPMKEESKKEKKKDSGSRKDKEKEEEEKRLKKEKEIPKEGRIDGYDDMKLESDRDNLEEKQEEKKEKKDASDPKKQKSESLKLKKTQSLSPVNIAAPILPGPPGKQTVVFKKTTITEDQMKTPPKEKSEKSGRVKIVEAERSDLDQPPPEPDFVQNHGDTKINRMEIKKVDLDLVGRTGMYLERIGMSAERKQAFDWIAYNRHDMKNKQKDFSKNMAKALSDIGINKHLLMRTVIYLKSHGQITPNEMDKVLKEIQACKGEIISFSQVSHFLKTHCETYQNGSKEAI